MRRPCRQEPFSIYRQCQERVSFFTTFACLPFPLLIYPLTLFFIFAIQSKLGTFWPFSGFFLVNGLQFTVPWRCLPLHRLKVWGSVTPCYYGFCSHGWWCLYKETALIDGEEDRFEAWVRKDASAGRLGPKSRHMGFTLFLYNGS